MEYASLERTDEVEAVDGVHLAQLAAGERMSVQHFRIEPGATVPEHSHHHEQSGFVYRGELTFLLEDGSEITAEVGDSYVFASDEPHAAENRGDEPVEGVDIFGPPRPSPPWED